MAESMNKLVESLVKQGSQKEGAAVLPHWIQEGAKLAYVSERSGQAFDVIIEGISHSKQQVRFVFESDRKSWKCVTFPQIIAGRNPLRKRDAKEKVVAAPAAESDAKDDAERELDSLEAKWSAKAADREQRKRGREKVAGPSLTAKQPRAWELPENVDSSPERVAVEVQDLDEEGPAAPQQPEDPDPYGLGEPARAAEAARAGAERGGRGGPEEPGSPARDRSRKGRRRARSADGERRARSADGDRRLGKDSSRREEKGRRRQEQRSRSRSRDRRKKHRAGAGGGGGRHSDSSAARRRARPGAGGEGEARSRRGKHTRKRSSSVSP